MPVITVDMLKGRSEQQKRDICAAMTKSLSEIAQVDPAAIFVIINEKDAENWSVGGETLKDSFARQE